MSDPNRTSNAPSVGDTVTRDRGLRATRDRRNSAASGLSIGGRAQHDRSAALGRSASSVSNRGGPGATDVEFDVFIGRSENEYPTWWTRSRLKQNFFSLSEDPYWNAYICMMVLAGIVWLTIGLFSVVLLVLDILYNVSYAAHVFAITCTVLMKIEATELTFCQAFTFVVDVMTYCHYVSTTRNLKLVCYYVRLHRPFHFLWNMNNKNLRSSVLGTALKFFYIFLVMRVTWALVWLNIDEYQRRTTPNNTKTRRALNYIQLEGALENSTATKYLSAFYLINKMYIPIGTSVPPANDLERLTCLAIMLSGCLVVTAFAVASLALVFSLYMRPEEAFRARYRLIIKEMKDSKVLQSQRDRVETFYKMYWHKQRAVSATQLLPLFPPTLPATIFTDVYFEATQKSKVLCNLSYQFLSDLSKKMETIHYIPGDSIIKRLSSKTAYIYITYGDVEMVTAEDDTTAILRLTRGSMLSPYAVCAPPGGPAHLEIRAATFCTAHVLRARDLWSVIIKHGSTDDETLTILGSYNDHLERVKTHYKAKEHEEVKHKSSIFHLKRCLLALKEAKDAQGQLILARTDIFLEVAESYIMRNRADATLTDESDPICLRPTFPYILQPTSSLLDCWNLLTTTIIMAVCFVHPYYLVFSKTVPDAFRFFDYLVTLLFILDLYVHLSTGANVEEGIPITLAQTSAQQMRSFWFVLGVLGTVPIFEFVGDGHFAGINKLLRVPKVFRFLKAKEEACVYQSHILRFMSYLLLMLIACYIIAALQQSFMCYQFGYCLVTNLTHSPFWEQKPLDEETIDNRVAFSMYSAVSMIAFTAHIETWGTENWKNVLYTLLVLEVCIVLRIFMEAVYSATILVTTALREDYDAAIAGVKSFMIRNRVDPVLRKRFISYLQLCWYTDKAYDMTNKRSIFYDLPPHVFQDIVAKQRSKYILSLPFMKYVSQEDLKTISSQAKLFYTSPNEILLNTGDICNEVYVIKQGICQILSPDTKTVIGLLNAKCHFGVIGCLLRIPAYYTIRTATNVQVFTVSRKYLQRVFEMPQVKDTLEFSRARPEYQGLLVRREPFISYVEPAPIPNRATFPLPRKHEPDNDFLRPFYRLGFFSILRYIFPRFTIRPDGTYLIRYEWFRATCAMMSAMVYPSYSFLSVQWPWLYYVTLLLDLSAIFDILQRMLIAYYDESGILIYHPSSTAAHYMKGAFFVDLFGCLALENLETPLVETGTGGKFKVTPMTQFLMMNRLLQLYRVPSAMMVLKNFIERRDILLVFKAIPLFVVLLNVVTSFMVLNSVEIYRYMDNDNWLIQPMMDEGGSWVHLFAKQFRFNLTESPFHLHLATYFWVVYECTTTGYSSIKPSNINLIRLLSAGMLISSMMITYFSVRIISIRANVNKDLAEFQEHMKDMVTYMKREGLSKDLQKIVLEYYEYSWDKMGGVDYRNMFKLCSQITLRTDAILHIYGPTFAKCPILTHTDISLMRLIGRAVHSAYFLRGMVIVEASDVISAMYFVDYGDVDARETVGEYSTLTKLPKGSVFGNLDGQDTVCCPFTFVATSRVHLLMINSAVFHHIIRDFPAVAVLMEKFRTNESYILGNVAEGGQSKTNRQSFISSPHIVTSRKRLIKHLYFKDKYIQIFLIIVAILCVFLDVYNAGFQDNSIELIIALYSLDLCFCCKILLQFIQPLVVDSTNVRRLLLPQRKAYFKGEFRYDLMSCIPLELFSYLGGRNRWRIFACLRLNRFLRVVSVYKGLKRHQTRITINLTLTTCLVAIMWFALFVHCTSCLWYFIGIVEEWRQEKSSWIYKDNGESWCNSEYICSFYFVLTTFTQNGVGDIMPKQQSEVIFVIILQIVSTMMYMIYVGEFSNIIQYQSFRASSFYGKYLELQEFLKNNRVSRNLVQIVNKYSMHLWRETRGMQEPHFLKTAPRPLRLEVMSAAYLHHLTRHHVFENCERAFLRQLVGCLQFMTYNEDMYVVKSSEITDSMYLIHTGKIEEIPDDSHVVPRIYPAGSYFGVVQGLVHDLPYTHSYRTLHKSQVLSLRLDDWLYLLKHYPASRDAINQHVKYDTGGDGGGGGGKENWTKKPFPPKPRRGSGRRVTLFSMPKKPPRPPDDKVKRDHKEESKPKKDFVRDKDLKRDRNTKRGGPNAPPSDEMSSLTKASRFVTPDAPKLHSVDNEPVTLQPRLRPSDVRLNDLETGTHDVNRDEINLDELRKKESKVSDYPSTTELVVANISAQDIKDKPAKQETGRIRHVELKTASQLMLNISGTSIAGDEQHVVTVDIAEGKTEAGKVMDIEQEELNMVSLDMTKDKFKEEEMANVKNKNKSAEKLIDNEDQEDFIEYKLEEKEVMQVEREESTVITIDISQNKAEKEIVKGIEHNEPFDHKRQELRMVSIDMAKGEERKHDRQESKDNVSQNIEREEFDMITIDMITDRSTKLHHEESSLNIFDDIRGKPVDDEEKNVERKESNIITIDLTAGTSKNENQRNIESEKPSYNRFDMIQGKSVDYEVNKIEPNESEISIVMTPGKYEGIKNIELDREESTMMTIYLPGGKTEKNTDRDEASITDLERTKVTKIDLTQVRSKTNIEPYVGEISVEAVEFGDSGGEIPATSESTDKGKRGEESESLPGQSKDKVTSMTKGRRPIHVRYEDSKKKTIESELYSAEKMPNISEDQGQEANEKTVYKQRNLRIFDSDVNVSIRTSEDEQAPVVGSNTSLTSITSQLTQGRPTKKKKENKKER